MQLDRLRLLGLGGSNKIMQGELSRLARRALTGERSRELLRASPSKIGPGGLAYPFDAELAALAVTYHRTSARVLWDLYASTCARLEPLYEELVTDVTADNRPWLSDGLKISVVAFGQLSVQAGERQVVGTVKNAIIDGAKLRGLTLRVDPQKPDLLVHVRSVPASRAINSQAPAAQGQGQGDKQLGIVVSLDLAGRPMHQRGYRTAAGLAPIREDLAANLVMLARHDARTECVIDPLAGAGTLLIEAALLGAGCPVWMSGRKPLATHTGGLEQQVASFRRPLFGDTRPMLFGAEVDQDAYACLVGNAKTAGVETQLVTFAGDFRDWELAEHLKEIGKLRPPGLILSNPPYGARLEISEHELERLYRDLGAWCRTFPGFRAAFLIGDSEENQREPSVSMFLRAFGGRPRVRKPMLNGPLRAQFLLYEM
jgi:23S rRNA G2445 N2-methylase RlmL